MSNTFAPNGFQAVRRLDGASWTGNLTQYKIQSGNTNKIFFGDPVSRNSSGYIDAVAPGALPTQGVCGIFAGYRASPPSNAPNSPWSNWYPGSSTSDQDCYLIDDPLVVLRVWVGTGSTVAATVAGGPAVQGDIGNNFNFSFGANSAATANGNTLSGISTACLNYATKGPTSTLPFTLIGLVTAPPGTNGTDVTTAGNLVEVVFNQQAFRVGTTGL